MKLNISKYFKNASKYFKNTVNELLSVKVHAFSPKITWISKEIDLCY